MRRILGLVLLMSGLAETTHAADKWLHARTDHFEMFSAASARDSAELLSSLELFRWLFLEILEQPVERNPQTLIVVFKRDRDFDDYKPIINGKIASMGGVCINQSDGTFIALSAERDTEYVLRTVYHEYVHQLVGAMGMSPPPWLNEGWAEVFEVFFRQRTSLTVGKAHEDHVRWLSQFGVMPLHQMLAVTRGSPDYTERNRQGKFYASSWLFVHYCLFGQSEVPRGALRRFMLMSEKTPNAPVDDLFEACFGCSVEEMQSRLRRYLDNGRYTTATTKAPETWSGKDVKFAPASDFARDLALLQIRARIRRDPAAAYLVRQLHDQRPDEPGPYELLGTISRMNNEPDMALDDWAKAVERGSGNAYIHLALVERGLGQWLKGVRLTQTIPDELAADWRTWLERALAIDPGDQRVIYWLAWLEACARNPSKENIARLEKAVPTQRKSAELFLGLALYRWRAGDHRTAATIVKAIATAPLERGQRVREELAAELGVELPADETSSSSSRGPKMPKIRVPEVGGG